MCLLTRLPKRRLELGVTETGCRRTVDGIEDIYARLFQPFLAPRDL